MESMACLMMYLENWTTWTGRPQHHAHAISSSIHDYKSWLLKCREKERKVISTLFPFIFVGRAVVK
jgi:hypothetical protein